MSPLLRTTALRPVAPAVRAFLSPPTLVALQLRYAYRQNHLATQAAKQRCSKRPPLRWLPRASNATEARQGNGGGEQADQRAHPAPQAPAEQSTGSAALNSDASEQGLDAAASSWSPRDLLTGRALVLGGSVATAVLLTVFRKEIAPALKWVVTQVSQLTDKSVIKEGNVEALATLVAVGLTLWWSFSEFQASSKRMKEMEEMEAQVGGRLEGALRRLERAEARLAAAEAEVAALRAELRSAQRGGSLAAAAGVENGRHAKGGQELAGRGQ